MNERTHKVHFTGGSPPLKAKKTRRRKKVSMAGEVYGVALMSAFLAGCVAAGIQFSVWWLSAGSLMGLVVLWRVYVWYLEDTRPPDELDQEFQDVVVNITEESPRVINYQTKNGPRPIQMDRRPAMVVEAGGRVMKLTPGQMDQLKDWWLTGEDGGGPRRDTSAVGKGWSDLDPTVGKKDWSIFRQVLVDAGLASENGKALSWDQDGVAWLNSWN